MKHPTILQAIDRIETDLARLLGEAAELRARVTGNARKTTMAFPAPSSASDTPDVASAAPRAHAHSAGQRAQHASIPVDTVPPVSRSRPSTRTSKARDTIPAPAPSEPPEEERSGRYGIVTPNRSRDRR